MDEQNPRILDDFNTPQPHGAPKKSGVDAVLSHVSRVGDSLLSLLSGLLAAVLILYSGYVLYDTFYTQNSAATTAFELLQYRPDILDDGAEPVDGADKLAKINEDYRAWVTLFDTNIDYPVMQGPDDLYYASHDVYGSISLTGAIYLAAGNDGSFSDSYSLLYGHHMDNGAMFGGLDAFTAQDYFDSHREGALVSSSGVYDLKIFAVVSTDAYESQIYSVGNRAAQVLSFLRARAAAPDEKTTVLLLDEETMNSAEQVLALSTCASAETNGRLVVFAKMTKRNLLTLEANGYTGVYDARAHYPRVKVNYAEGTTYSYSTDGGQTWTEGLPSITDVGARRFLIRASHPAYGTAEQSVVLQVTPKPITLKARDSFKYYSQKDPVFLAAPCSGIIDDFEPTYTIRRANADVEDIGLYEDVLIIEGEEFQGNYQITYEPGDFAIVPAGSLALVVDGYTGVYDGKEHGLGNIEVNHPEGTVIKYSIDGGETWTLTPPTIIDVGRIRVLVRASHPGYESATAEAWLIVTPAEAVVTAKEAEKTVGEDDPDFEAEVTGVLRRDSIEFTVTRPGAGEDEAPGRYAEAIVAAGAEYQGNYHVTYVAADFTIHPAPVVEEEPKEEDFFDRFEPKPSRGGAAWALLNLICVIVTAYLFLPLLHLGDKFSRARTMRRLNREKNALFAAEELDDEQKAERAKIVAAALREREEDDGSPVTEEEFYAAVEALNYAESRFSRRARIGLVLELLTVIAAIVAFILTEDMRNPMVIIDKWTPLMLAILALAWIEDVRLLRYREKKEEKEQKELAAAAEEG